jgi:uncharacterized membrane protein YeaQ/YmgE (transglycosylase-associated protein family)
MILGALIGWIAAMYERFYYIGFIKQRLCIIVGSIK